MFIVLLGDVGQLRAEVQASNVAPDQTVPPVCPTVHGDQDHREGPVRKAQEGFAGRQPGQEDIRRYSGQCQDQEMIYHPKVLLQKVIM